MHKYIFDLAISIAKHTVQAYIEQEPILLESSNFQGIADSLLKTISRLETATRKYNRDKKAAKDLPSPESAQKLLLTKRELKRSNLAGLYFTYGCLYFLESFKSFDYSSRLTYYNINVNMLMEAEDLFTSCVKYCVCCDYFRFDSSNLSFMRGFVAYLLEYDILGKIGSVGNIAITELSKVMQQEEETGSFSLRIPCLHLLCLLEKYSPASILLLSSLEEECEDTKKELQSSPYIQAQQSNLEPSDSKYYLFLAFKHLFDNNYEQAIKHLKDGLEKDPKCADYYYYLNFLTRDSEYRKAANKLIAKSDFTTLIRNPYSDMTTDFLNPICWEKEKENLSYLKSKYIACNSVMDAISFLEQEVGSTGPDRMFNDPLSIF